MTQEKRVVINADKSELVFDWRENWASVTLIPYGDELKAKRWFGRGDDTERWVELLTAVLKYPHG